MRRSDLRLARVRCTHCGFRFEADPDLEEENRVVCPHPHCRRLTFAVREALDNRWWAYRQGGAGEGASSG